MPIGQMAGDGDGGWVQDCSTKSKRRPACQVGLSEGRRRNGRIVVVGARNRGPFGSVLCLVSEQLALAACDGRIWRGGWGSQEPRRRDMLGNRDGVGVGVLRWW